MAALLGRLRLLCQNPRQFPDGRAGEALKEDLGSPLAFILREDPRPIGYPIQLQRILLQDAARVAYAAFAKANDGVHLADDVAGPSVVVHEVVPKFWVALTGVSHKDQRRWFNDRLQMGNHLLHGRRVILLPAMCLPECINDYNDWLDRIEGRTQETKMIRLENIKGVGV